MNNEFAERCDKAIRDLEELAELRGIDMNTREQARLRGKIEGVKLAKGYYIEMERERTRGIERMFSA